MLEFLALDSLNCILLFIVGVNMEPVVFGAVAALVLMVVQMIVG